MWRDRVHQVLVEVHVWVIESYFFQTRADQTVSSVSDIWNQMWFSSDPLGSNLIQTTCFGWRKQLSAVHVRTQHCRYTLEKWRKKTSSFHSLHQLLYQHKFHYFSCYLSHLVLEPTTLCSPAQQPCPWAADPLQTFSVARHRCWFSCTQRREGTEQFVWQIFKDLLGFWEKQTCSVYQRAFSANMKRFYWSTARTPVKTNHFYLFYINTLKQ